MIPLTCKTTAPASAAVVVCGLRLVRVLQAKSAVSAAERDRKQLEQQSQDVSQAIEAATAALQEVQRQIRAAEVGGSAHIKDVFPGGVHACLLLPCVAVVAVVVACLAMYTCQQGQTAQQLC